MHRRPVPMDWNSPAIVSGRPFLILGGQINNAGAWAAPPRGAPPHDT